MQHEGEGVAHQNQRPEPGSIKLRCPNCGRFLADVRGYVHVRCRDCALEVTYRTAEERSTHGASIHLLTAS